MKNNVYPCKPQFYYIKVGFKGGQNYIGMFVCVVCVEVSRPSQPNGVMSSAVSLPNQSSKRLTSIVHILSPETDNCPS